MMEISKSLTLNTLNNAKELIQRANVSQLKEIISRAEALRVYAAQAKKGLEIQNQVAEIKLRAERRIGERLKEMPKKHGARPADTELQDVTPSLKDLGIEKIESHRWQAVASLPEKDFERHIGAVRKSNEELTSVGVIRLARELMRHKEKPSLDSPKGKYDIIYADPPWSYGNSQFLQEKRGIGGKVTSAADLHYPIMEVEELKALPINNLANKNCLLFIWTSSPHLEFAIQIINSWGFEYKTIAFVWDKQKINPSAYTLSQVEICLVAKKGSIPEPRGARNVKQFLSEERKEHSKKPDEVRKRITVMFPTQKKIELFARNKAEGWDVWGNEI